MLRSFVSMSKENTSCYTDGNLETKRLAKLFVGLVPTSAVTAAFPHATTKASVILAGDPSGRMLHYARSMCVAATSAFVAQQQIFVTELLRHRLNVVRGQLMRSS
jgi:hypothetical protein